MKHYGYVYKVTTSEGDTYVGKHRSEKFDERYFGKGRRIKDYIKAHGKDRINREVLCWANSESELTELETKMIRKHNPTMNLMKESFEGFGYINRNRLNGTPMKGRPHSEETKKRIAESVKRFLKEHPEKIKPMTEEQKKKMSEFRKGKPSPAKGKTWKLSEETKEKIREANRKRLCVTHLSEERKEHMRKHWKNQYSSSEETV